MFRNITCSNRPDRVAQLAEHWASNPKVVGSIPTVVRLIFQACLEWIYTQSNITSIIVDIVSLKALNRRYEAANLVGGSLNTILDLTRKINNLSRVTCICSIAATPRLFKNLFSKHCFNMKYFELHQH